MLLLKQKMFLGVSSVVSMITDEEKMKSAGMMNINTDKHSISSVVVVVVCLFRVISFHPFWKFGMGLFGGLIFSPGIFLEALGIWGAY